MATDLPPCPVCGRDPESTVTSGDHCINVLAKTQRKAEALWRKLASKEKP